MDDECGGVGGMIGRGNQSTIIIIIIIIPAPVDWTSLDWTSQTEMPDHSVQNLLSSRLLSKNQK
jgi:hypothetical protein